MNEELPRHVIRWPEHGIDMAFRLIPAGSFRMGSRGYYPEEEPIHTVKISDSFWLGETPVTQAQFALWTQSEKIDHQNHLPGHPDHPAGSMDWRQSVSFCAWLAASKAPELPEDGGLVCLPTEAEWEYACRAGTQTEYYMGDGEAALAEAGWFGEDYDSGSTHPVGQKTANGFGLYDMHGNVWEWCHDAWDEWRYRGSIDGEVDRGRSQRRDDWKAGVSSMIESDQTRVLRGGCWFDSAGVCRSACRHWCRPGDRAGILGYRVCLVRGPEDGSRAQEPNRETGATGDGGRGTRPESDGAGRRMPDLAGAQFPREAGRNFLAKNG